MLFEPIQQTGQDKLANSAVLVVGAGALGTVICNQLARAGIGKIRLVDRDYVEYSNLQRQILFDESDAAQSIPKAIAAKNKLQSINSEIEIEAFVANVSNDNIEQFVSGVDVVMDGTDNFATRYLLNDICYKKNIPYSYGGVVSSRGMTAFFIPEETPCMRCLFKGEANSNQTCDTVGVIAPAVDIISSLQVTEVFKYLTDNTKHLRRTLKTIDIWYNHQYDLKFPKPDSNCPSCQKRVFPALMKAGVSEETVLCGRNTVQIHQETHFDLDELATKLSRVATIKKTPFLLKVLFDESITFVIFSDGRVLVQGTEDTLVARSFYDRYIGS